MTFNVNVQKSFTAIESVVDGFRGEGSLLSMMKSNLSTPTGVDFELDILANLANRGTYFQWVERPVKLNSQRTVVAFHVKDITLAAESLKKFAETGVGEGPAIVKVVPPEREYDGRRCHVHFGPAKMTGSRETPFCSCPVSPRPGRNL